VTAKYLFFVNFGIPSYSWKYEAKRHFGLVHRLIMTFTSQPMTNYTKGGA